MQKAKGLVLMLLCGSIALTTSTTKAQVKVVGPGYPITHLAMTNGQRQSYEHRCQYFLFTTILGADQPRLAFSYVLPDGTTDPEMPRIENVSIVIDESKATPVVQDVKKDDGGPTQYVLAIDSTTADDAHEGTCLTGVVRKKK